MYNNSFILNWIIIMSNYHYIGHNTVFYLCNHKCYAGSRKSRLVVGQFHNLDRNTDISSNFQRYINPLGRSQTIVNMSESSAVWTRLRQK